LYFAVILIAEKYFLMKFLERLPAFVRHVYTLLLVVVSWVIFYFEDLGVLGGYLAGMFGFKGVPLYNSKSLYYLLGYGIIFILAAYFSTPHFKHLIDKTERSTRKVVWSAATAAYVLVFGCCVAYLVNSSYNPFLYFRF
jgi:alginate O-acetyltransferase complex protein AlgI